jgi:hypothetical protein
MPIVFLLLLAFIATRLDAQQWDSPEVHRLVQHAIDRRLETRGDSALQNYRAEVSGFVFFSTQIGEGLSEPPRLIKADQLAAEVYWRTPGLSKQIITAWRDRRYLPTDIDYHRDHLSMVVGNLADRITVGEGDEVRNVLHPFAPGGASAYQYALGDSISILMAHSTIYLVAVDFRPRDPAAGLAVGRAYLARERGDIVRLRLGFTAAAYRDETVEDITFVLENSLYEGRFWLPFRQEIEVRRRVAWFDFPARTLIRVRWSVDNILVNVPLDPALFRGPILAGLPGASDSGGPWTESLERAAEEAARPLSEQDLETARLEIRRLVGPRVLQTMSGARIGTNSVSDLVLVNRVNGLRLGLGGSASAGGFEGKAWLGYGTSDGRLLTRLRLSTGVGGGTVMVEGYRRVVDLSDVQVISTVLNSFRSQEAGTDLGDYVLLSGVRGLATVPLSVRSSIVLGLGLEQSRSMMVAATPVHGTYRPNQPLGAGDYILGSVTFKRRDGGVGLAKDLYGEVRLEAGDGPTQYFRIAAEVTGVTTLGGRALVARGYGGWGSEGLPTYRSFVLGGRGTLPGEPFRAYGGRSMVLLHVEWRPTIPVPAASFGTFASSGSDLLIAPFVAAGWSNRAIPGTNWRATGGVRPVLGVGVEWLMNLVRLDVGVGLLDGGVQVTVDVTRGWWPLL